jgi:26S proteasome non-ATPase regulatory subunit 9
MALPVPEGISNVNLPLPDPEAYPGEPREYARALMQRKDEIDQEVVSPHPSTPVPTPC